MKKTISFMAVFGIIAIILSSCSSLSQPFINFSMIDYRPFSKEGFFFSESNSVSFDYIPIGSAEVVIGSGKTSISKDYDDYRDQKPNNKKKIVLKATPEEAAKYLYMYALENGADGVINLHFSTKQTNTPQKLIMLSGMMIKRK